MTDQSAIPEPRNCGLPDGAYHFHVERCWQAGHDAAVTAMATPTDVQSWARPVPADTPGAGEAAVVLHLAFDGTGRALVHEAVLAQLLVDAGWERTR